MIKSPFIYSSRKIERIELPLPLKNSHIVSWKGEDGGIMSAIQSIIEDLLKKKKPLLTRRSNPCP